MLKKIKTELSKLGKAMLIPIAATPAAGILARISAPDLLNLPILNTAAGTIFGMLDVLFAFGAAYAYSKPKEKSYALLSAVISLAVFKTTLIAINPTLNMGVFAGILIGVITAIVYNHSRTWKTPDIFSFFTGDKFVVTLSPITAVPLAFLVSLFWGYCQSGLNIFTLWLTGLGAFGVFLFGFFNRLLIPIGLHHVLNTYIYYELGSYTTKAGEIVKGEIPRFLAGDPTAGLFLAMFFVTMMFGLPGACLAIYQTAKAKKKEETKSLMLSGATTTFITGITEPIEFSFLFVAPKLYVVHAFYTGLAGAILTLLNVHMGTASSFGLIDYIFTLGLATRGLFIIPIGIIFFILYYITFKFLIIKNDLKTPGREDDLEITNEISEEELNIKLESSNYDYMAKKILQNIGGKENIINIEHCITRLRLELKDISKIDEQKIKQTGARGIMKLDDNNIQIIIGTSVNKVFKEFKNYLDEK